MIRFDFHDRHVFVNGGSSGIGRAIVLAFAAAGAEVSFVYHDGDAGNALAGQTQELAGGGPGAIVAREVDCSDWDAIHEAVAAFDARTPIDVLVNVAGVTRDSMSWKMTQDDWNTVMRINAGGYFACIHAAAPFFRARKRGRIINVSSINGMRGKAGQANYAASKAAVIGLTKTLAKELGPSNVTVNAIAPGFVLTAMTEALPEDVRQRAIAETATGHACTPEDIAHAALFLASDEARQITGVVLKVDGGQYI